MGVWVCGGVGVWVWVWVQKWGCSWGWTGSVFTKTYSVSPLLVQTHPMSLLNPLAQQACTPSCHAPITNAPLTPSPLPPRSLHGRGARLDRCIPIHSTFRGAVHSTLHLRAVGHWRFARRGRAARNGAAVGVGRSPIAAGQLCGESIRRGQPQRLAGGGGAGRSEAGRCGGGGGGGSGGGGGGQAGDGRGEGEVGSEGVGDDGDVSWVRSASYTYPCPDSHAWKMESNLLLNSTVCDGPHPPPLPRSPALPRRSPPRRATPRLSHPPPLPSPVPPSRPATHPRRTSAGSSSTLTRDCRSLCSGAAS